MFHFVGSALQRVKQFLDPVALVVMIGPFEIAATAIEEFALVSLSLFRYQLLPKKLNKILQMIFEVSTRKTL